MLEQVRISEQTATGSTRVFGFGTHPAAVDADGAPDPAQEHHVTSATAQGNSMRLIIDELLVGNELEELQCRGIIDEDDYDSVPLGATPDDVARCAASKDVLVRTCAGPKAMCVCHLPGGCTTADGPVANGDAVGILDKNEDGAADNTRMIEGAVGIRCSGASGTPLEVPIDQEASYYNPAGTQNVPAVGGFEALGPAVIVTALGALPTSQTCSLYFSPSVTDKQGNQVCAPPDGLITEDCTADGDISAFSFTVQPIVLTLQSFIEGAMGVSITDPITVISNVPLADDAASFVTIATAGGVAFTNFTAELMNGNRAVVITPTGAGFAKNTAYVITFPTTIKDSSGSPLTMPFTVHFTTTAT